jgi:L-fucose mutarotase/ribose pyranase (RbsD/FucU family)
MYQFAALLRLMDTGNSTLHPLIFSRVPSGETKVTFVCGVKAKKKALVRAATNTRNLASISRHVFYNKTQDTFANLQLALDNCNIRGEKNEIFIFY